MSRSVQEEPLQTAMSAVDDDRTGIKVETLKQSGVLKTGRVLTAESYANAPEADIEDLLTFGRCKRSGGRRINRDAVRLYRIGVRRMTPGTLLGF